MKIKLSIITLLVGVSFSAIAQDYDVQGLVEQGQYQAALTELEKLSSIDLPLMKLKAVSHLQLEQYSEAEQVYLSIKQFDDGVDVSNNLGLVYLRQARFEEAISAFQNTIRRFPSDEAAYKNLGDIYLYLAQATYSKGAESVTANTALQSDVDRVAAFFTQRAESVSPYISDAEEPNEELQLALEESAEPALSQALPDLPKSQSRRIERMIASWAKARSDNDRDTYVSFYDSAALVGDLSPSDNDGEVRALEPSLQLVSDGVVSVVFDEWTGPYSKRTRLFKELQLALSDDGWKITEEKVVHVYPG